MQEKSLAIDLQKTYSIVTDKWLKDDESTTVELGFFNDIQAIIGLEKPDYSIHLINGLPKPIGQQIN